MSKKFTYNEMMAHIPVCSHKTPKSLLLVSDKPDGIQEELNRHSDVSVTVGGLDSIANGTDNSFDIVLIDSKAELSTATYAHLNRIVKEDGLVSALNDSLSKEDSSKAQMTALGQYFKIVMPYRAGHSTMILASKEYHPTADVILQRSDLIDGLEYYNCDIHIASFVMPNHIRSTYRGIIKN